MNSEKTEKMKKLVFIAICTVGMFAFSSCGSSKPCGLASKTKQTKQVNYQQNVVVADATVK